MRQQLALLPVSFRRPLSEHAVETVTNIIETYDIGGRSRLGRPVITCRRRYEVVCLFILKAVFLPCIEECNIDNIRSEFAQELLSQSLETNTNITRLILPEDASAKVSQCVFSNLQTLRRLQEFTFHCSCTTDIVIELGKHCILLRLLDVTKSRLVTDECVGYLMNLQNLEKLHVSGTSISGTYYSLLLSSLPRIQNITWWSSVDIILQNITKECLPSVNHLCGVVSETSLVKKLCPQIRHLLVLLGTDSSLGIIHLTEVVTLELIDCDYTIGKIRILFENMGFRLTHLDIFLVENINISEIIKCCSVLMTLICRYCGIILPENLIFPPELPHFKSVKKITLLNNSDLRTFHKYLHHYVNLEVLVAECFRELDNVTVSAILNAGGFRKLSDIVLVFCGYLTLQTAMLLIEKCDNLRRLGNLNAWYGVSVDGQNSLFDFVKVNNLTLTVVL
jgi:hypothetical protein